MARSWLARLAIRAASADAGPFAPKGAPRRSSSSGGSAGGAAAPAARSQAPPVALGPIAQLQQAQLHGAHSGPGTLGKPVVMPVGALVLTGAALLGGGMLLGALTEKLHQQAEAPRQATGGSGSSSSNRGSGALAPHASSRAGNPVGEAGGSSAATAWPHLSLADYIPSFMSHSQARNAAPAGSGSAAADVRSSAGGASPLGGCLSPYYISDAAAKAAPAVVNITVQASGALPVGSSGSGFIVDADGTILTNAHVVSDAIQRHYYGGGPSSGGGGGGGTGVGAGPGGKGITVTLQDGRIFEGRLVSYDTVSDLAVLRIESDSPLPTAKLGRSASLRVGEWVVALGSPLHLQNSVTAGIVSCVDRKAVELGLAGARTDYIQTDAAINKGNSGGPLVNLFGEVVGISAMKAVAADGVSFAIPVDTAVDVMRQLKEHGRVIRPYVGIKMLQLNKHNAAQFRKRDPAFPRVEAGILVPGVHLGSPAERAGLRPGDCIIGFGEPPCRPDQVTTTALIKALGEHIGRPLALRVARPGDKVESLSVVAQEAGEGLH